MSDLSTRPARETPKAAFWVLLIFSVSALTFVFRHIPDPWIGMTAVMGLALAVGVLPASVHRRLKPKLSRIAIGLAAAGVLYGITRLAVLLLSKMWPGWVGPARLLYAWRGGHSALFLASTLVLIVVAEEVVWRGVVARFLMERRGKPAGVLSGAVIYAAAHWATLNPLLLFAALGCGIFWGLLYAWTDDLVAPATCHLAWDAMILFAFPVV